MLLTRVFVVFQELSGSDSDWEDNDDDSNDDDGEEWVNVSHSEDEAKSGDEDAENGEKEKQGLSMDPQVRKDLASQVSLSTILTDEDFKKIETLQLQKEILSARKGSAKKRKASDIDPTNTAKA